MSFITCKTKSNAVSPDSPQNSNHVQGVYYESLNVDSEERDHEQVTTLPSKCNPEIYSEVGIPPAYESESHKTQHNFVINNNDNRGNNNNSRHKSNVNDSKDNKNNDSSNGNNSNGTKNNNKKLTITSGKTTRINLPPPSPDTHVKIEMDSNGLIYVFQTVWKNSSPIESKLKVFNLHDDPLCIHKKWIWNQEKAKRFYLSKNKFEKMVPVDMTLCDDEVHVVTQTDNKTFGLEKWRKMTDILNGEISLAQTGIDRLSTFSIAGARKYLLLVQRKADCFLQFVIMDGQVIRLSCTLNISVERQPKFSVIGDYLLFPHLNSFDILRWREGSTILVDPVQLTIRTINVIGDRWQLFPFKPRKKIV